MKRAVRSVLLLSAFLGAGCFASHYRSNPRLATVGGDPIVQMIEPGKLPSATHPPMVPLSRHSDPPAGRQRILALSAPVPRAYPIGLLDRFEVVNDSAGDVPYVVVRCALAQVAAVFSRDLDGRVLTFENSGALWRDTLVLRDLETGTLWSAATGVALTGPLASRVLPPIPAVYTTARAWQRAFPDSTYMDLRESTAVPFLMKLYGASPWQGVSGRKTTDRRHHPKAEFFGVVVDDEVFAVPEELLREQKLVRAEIGGQPLTMSWDERLEAPRAHISGVERPALPMYWFALSRHFETVRTPDS